jgi:hypothetical protein
MPSGQKLQVLLFDEMKNEKNSRKNIFKQSYFFESQPFLLYV